MIALLLKHPVLTATVVGVALSFLATQIGIAYDSAGAASILFYAGMILQVCVNVAHEVIHSVPALKSINHNGLLSVCLGIFLAALLDWILMLARGGMPKDRSQKPAP